MNTITVNGVTFQTEGKNISVINGQVKVDGKIVTEIEKNIKITWQGELASLTTDASVECQDVSGSIEAGGSVTCKNVGGSVTATGSITCGNIKGSVTAGGSVCRR